MYKFVFKNWGLFVILILSIIPLLPLFHTGFFPIHDDTQVARVFEIGKGLVSGMIPVRWAQDLGYGYGYPIFTFYAPLAFYFGGLFFFFGFSALVATKIMMGIGIVVSGVFMYYLARDFWGEQGGVLSGLLYLYAPYHALDIYVRGDVAEFWAYAFIPIVFYGIWKMFQTRKMHFIILGALGFAGIILSHNLTALMVTPFVVLFSIVLLFCSKQKLRTTYSILLTIILGLGLSAFYWLPVPFEMHFTNVLSQVGGGADFHKNFVCLSQLWNSQWGYGGSIPGCIDGISFAVGKIYIVFLGLGIILLPFILKKDRIRGFVVLGGLIGVGISLFLLLQVSESLWNIVHVMAFLQYPWRFLLFVFFFLSFISGSSIWLLQKSLFAKKSYGSLIVTGFVVVMLILIEGKYFVPQTYFSSTSDFYTNKTTLEWTTSKISDEYMPQGFQKPQNPTQIVSKRFILLPASGIILSQNDKTQEKVVKIFMNNPSILFINLAYFPGWKAYVDGREVLLQSNKKGVFLSVPQGIHVVKLLYTGTLIETIANCITCITILGSILGIIVLRKKKL